MSLTAPRYSNEFEVSRAGANAKRLPNAAVLRGVLIAACALAGMAAYFAGSSGAASHADAELVFLLRGMALLKAAFVLFAAGVLWWRFGSPISLGLATGYILCAAAATGGTVLIWTMTQMGAASLLFHGALIAFLVLGLRDNFRPKLGWSRAKQ